MWSFAVSINIVVPVLNVKEIRKEIRVAATGLCTELKV